VTASLGTEELQTKALGNKPQVQNRGRDVFWRSYEESQMTGMKYNWSLLS